MRSWLITFNVTLGIYIYFLFPQLIRPSLINCFIYGIRRCLIGVGLITEVKQRRARFIIGWVTAWDCQVPYRLGHRAAMSCRGAQRTMLIRWLALALR